MSFQSSSVLITTLTVLSFAVLLCLQTAINHYMQDSALNLQGRVCELDGELDSYFEQGLILYNMLEFRKKTK